MDFERIKSKIYPWIKVTSDLGDSSPAITIDEANSPIIQPWLGNLIVTYAVDEGDRFELLQNRHIPVGLTVAEIHAIALQNLASNVQFQFAQTAFGGHGLLAGGDHETGALCWPGIWEWCAATIGDDLVVAAPAKDLLMMVPANDPTKVRALRQFVDDFFVTGTRHLTRQLFQWNRATNHWTLYNAPF